MREMSFWYFAWRWLVLLAASAGFGLAIYCVSKSGDAVAILSLAALIWIVLFGIPGALCYWMSKS